MRLSALWICVPISLLVAMPADAAERPPRPIVAGHGVTVKAGYVGQCPRHHRKCTMPDVFVSTEAVPVDPDGLLAINTRRHVRRLRLDLDCPHRRVRSFADRRWLFELSGAGCSTGELLLTYRRRVASYTFNLETHEHCRPDGSTTVAENELVRIYTLDYDYDGYPNRIYYACRLASGTAFRMGRDGCGDAYEGCYYIRYPVLVADRVAYVVGGASYRYENDNRFSLVVLNTTTGEDERTISDGSPDGTSDRQITDVALKSNGSVAWILRKEDYTPAGPPYWTTSYEVRKSNQTTPNALIESSPDIDRDSLTLEGSTLGWTRAGEPQTATLD
jgi:hypothetical protein